VEDSGASLISGHCELTSRDYFRVIKDKLLETFYQRNAMQLIGRVQGGTNQGTRIGCFLRLHRVIKAGAGWDGSRRISSTFRTPQSSCTVVFDDSAQGFCGPSTTPEYDRLPRSTVSCETIRPASRIRHSWRMPFVDSSDHLAEIAAILAAGLLRLQSRKSSPNLATPTESPLDCAGNYGGDVIAKIEISRL
jgi:hypothetical protein